MSKSEVLTGRRKFWECLFVTENIASFELENLANAAHLFGLSAAYFPPKTYQHNADGDLALLVQAFVSVDEPPQKQKTVELLFLHVCDAIELELGCCCQDDRIAAKESTFFVARSTFYCIKSAGEVKEQVKTIDIVKEEEEEEEEEE